MKPERTSRGRVALLGLCFALLVFFTVSATAQPAPGAQECSETWQNSCVGRSSVNQCPSGRVCKIFLGVKNGKIAVTRDDATTSAETVCVSFGTTIEWDEQVNDSSFVVNFSRPSGTKLFGDKNTILSGWKTADSGGPATEIVNTPDHATPKQCNKYTVHQCSPGGPCISEDPKVIVNGGGGGGPHKTKKKS
jgi:hypothetical protein